MGGKNLLNAHPKDVNGSKGGRRYTARITFTGAEFFIMFE